MKKIKDMASLDTLLRMTLPKAATVVINLFQVGFRFALRSAVQLFRATIFTRVLSALTILALDLYGLKKKQISKVQFVRNILLSVLLIVFGTIGWNIGAGWFAIEIIGGLIGATLMGVAVPSLFNKLVGKFVESDEEKMMKIVDECLKDTPPEDCKKIKEKITSSKLKKMFASSDKTVYAQQLIEECKKDKPKNSNKQNLTKR